MTLELIEEINPMNGTMYAVKADNQVIKWFISRTAAERFYDLVKDNPSEIEPKKTVLKSTEISQ